MSRTMTDNEQRELTKALRSGDADKWLSRQAAAEIDRLAHRVQILEEALQMCQDMNWAAVRAGLSVEIAI